MSRFHKGPSKRQLAVIVERFNREFPVGSKVILRKDSGSVETEVTSPAIVLQGHSAVASFKGVSGMYSIEDSRVTPLVMAHA
jgi:hypothetical protein